MNRRVWLAMIGGAFLSIPASSRAADPIRVVVWDEQQPAQKEAYENFLGNAIADHLGKQPGITVKSVKLDDPEQGLSDATLDNCDVLIWWGHVRHAEVKPEKARKIVELIKAGKLSLIALHSAHWSAPFVEAMNERARFDALQAVPEADRAKTRIEEIKAKPFSAPKRDDPKTPSAVVFREPNGTYTIKLMLPNCCFPAYRNDGKPSHVQALDLKHPVCKGLPERFDIPRTEMYDDPFHVPTPDEILFLESWDAGERFRSGLVWKVGDGRVFYFRPGHETYPVYKQAEPLKVLENAVRWLGAKP